MAGERLQSPPALGADGDMFCSLTGQRFGQGIFQKPLQAVGVVVRRFVIHWRASYSSTLLRSRAMIRLRATYTLPGDRSNSRATSAIDRPWMLDSTKAFHVLSRNSRRTS